MEKAEGRCKQVRPQVVIRLPMAARGPGRQGTRDFELRQVVYAGVNEFCIETEWMFHRPGFVFGPPGSQAILYECWSDTPMDPLRERTPRLRPPALRTCSSLALLLCWHSMVFAASPDRSRDAGKASQGQST